MTMSRFTRKQQHLRNTTNDDKAVRLHTPSPKKTMSPGMITTLLKQQHVIGVSPVRVQDGSGDQEQAALNTLVKLQSMIRKDKARNNT
jgi:hypothetical protein